MSAQRRGAVAATKRLVLFDIDGTLLSTGPAARTTFASALEDVYGTSGDVEGYAFEGRLDPLIVTDLMRAAGVADETIAARRADALALYLDRLEAALSERPPSSSRGFSPLLDALEKVPGLVLALLTGNVERGARLKLSSAGIWHRFTFGVWGDDAPCREELGPVALDARPARDGPSLRGLRVRRRGRLATRRRVRPLARSARRRRRHGAHRAARARRRGSARASRGLLRHAPGPGGDPWLTRAVLSGSSCRPSRPPRGALAAGPLAAQATTPRPVSHAPGPPFDLAAPTPHRLSFTIDTAPARDVLALLGGAPDAPATLRRLKASANATAAIRAEGLSPDDFYGRLVSTIAGTPDPLLSTFIAKIPYFTRVLDAIETDGTPGGRPGRPAHRVAPARRRRPSRRRSSSCPSSASPASPRSSTVRDGDRLVLSADLPRLTGDLASAPMPREVVLKLLRAASAEGWRFLFDAHVRKAPAWPDERAARFRHASRADDRRGAADALPHPRRLLSDRPAPGGADRARVRAVESRGGRAPRGEEEGAGAPGALR